MKYFTIAELCCSNTADCLGIDNRCGEEQMVNLTALLDNVLDSLREWYGKTTFVNSGYPCPELNKAIKDAGTSQHMNRQAADISAGRQQNRLLFEYIRKNLPFDQLISLSTRFFFVCAIIFLISFCVTICLSILNRWLHVRRW